MHNGCFLLLVSRWSFRVLCSSMTLVLIRTFSIMYDNTLFYVRKSPNQTSGHMWVGCQPGDCRQSLIFLKDLHRNIWVNMLIYQPCESIVMMDYYTAWTWGTWLSCYTHSLVLRFMPALFTLQLWGSRPNKEIHRQPSYSSTRTE